MSKSMQILMGELADSIPLWFLRPSCFSKMERKQSVARSDQEAGTWKKIVKKIYLGGVTDESTIAGNVKDIKEGTTLAQLVVDEKVENPEYVTVTVNDDFVENHDLANVTLKENDVVEFLYFMGGGSF